MCHVMTHVFVENNVLSAIVAQMSAINFQWWYSYINSEMV